MDYLQLADNLATSSQNATRKLTIYLGLIGLVIVTVYGFLGDIQGQANGKLIDNLC